MDTGSRTNFDNVASALADVRLDLHMTSFLIEAVLEGAAEVSAQLAREKGVTVQSYVDPLIPPLQGDADRLRQILLNLLGNAVKFTERGQVVARALPLEITAHDFKLRFEVQDTGIGLAPDVLPRLFEPFVQADAVTSRKFGGTGLGLSISKRLVELMGGEIGVQSDLGFGSLFWFIAPFWRATSPISVQDRSLDGMAALIVSGDTLFAQIIERYMMSWRMKSCHVTNRIELINAMKSSEGHTWVAIVDLDHSSDSGMTEVVEVLRAILPARIITIGGDGPIRKPVRQSMLFDAIVKAYGVQATREPAAIAPQKSSISGGLI